MTIFKPKWLLKGDQCPFFYCRAPFQFNNYPSESKDGAKKVIYDVPRAPSIDDHQVYPCCGLFKLEKWEVRYHSCADIIQPYR